MDLPQVASEIQELTQQLNVWTSTFRLTSESFLDIGCAAMGEESSTPIGATDQPTKYPPGKNGSVYQFPTIYRGEELWPALYEIIQNSISGCTIAVQQTYPSQCQRQAAYHLCCQHGRKHEGISKVIMQDHCVGPSNVPHEHLKFVKKSGNKSKGIVFFNVVSVSIITMKYYPSLQQFISFSSQARKEWHQRSNSVLLLKNNNL
jgi:hypothetical protein